MSFLPPDDYFWFSGNLLNVLISNRFLKASLKLGRFLKIFATKQHSTTKKAPFQLTIHKNFPKHRRDNHKLQNRRTNWGKVFENLCRLDWNGNSFSFIMKISVLYCKSSHCLLYKGTCKACVVLWWDLSVCSDIYSEWSSVEAGFRSLLFQTP